MIHYSQIDPRWSMINIGNSNSKIGWFGCFMVSLSMLTNEFDPIKANEILTANNGYSGDMINSQYAATALGLKLDWTDNNPLGISKAKPDHICIAKTYHYDKPSTTWKETHFYVYAPKGTVSQTEDLILDPLSPPEVQWENADKYKVAEWRLFHEKKNELQTNWEEMKRRNVLTSHSQWERSPNTAETMTFILRNEEYQKKNKVFDS